MARVTIVLRESETGKTVGRHVDRISEETARIMFLKGDKTSAVSPN
jgi:hypothetical protein